ncbi:MAG: T9SS type A sorting domain-containing protein [Saprospiraceae bacterium]|jgi:hypothetical protein|nr:T9SS type A sorting domain-containing protein [Saprospiraceae bacterium]
MNRFLFLLAFGAATCSADLANAQASAAAQTVFFMQLDLDRGYVMCPTGTGNLYIAGMRGVDFTLLEMTSEGGFVSSRVIDVGILGLDAISDMIVDSDGNLVVTGNLKEDSPDNCYVFRYNPVLGQTLWAKMFGANQSQVLGVLENGPGGNFIVYTRRVFPNIDNAEFFQMNRTNGNIVPGTAWWYFDGSFHSMILHNGRLLAAGSWLDGTGTLSDANALMYINPSTGDPDWAYLERISPNTTARLYGRDLVAEGAAIISTFSGNDDGDNLSTSSIYLQKNAINGSLMWLKKIDLTEWSAEFAEEIISVPDGYVLYGRALTDDALFLLKTDKNGELLWARRIKHATKNRILASAQNQLVALGDFLFATGYTVDASGDARMFVLKTDACGMVGDSCSVLVPTGAIASTIVAPDIHATTPSFSFSATLPFNTPVASPMSIAVQKEIICQEIVGGCNDPDLVFEINDIQCGGGGIALSYTLCNVGGAPVSGNIPVWFYPEGPTQNATSEIGSTLIFLNTPLGIGECRSGVLSGITWFPSGIQEVFSVINHAGNLPTPFSFSDFPTTTLIECDYSNNLFGLTFSLPVSPVLDLGPDIILCTDSVYVFDAGPGFISYLWQDGSSGNTFTAADPGLYWVEVTDACGFVQRDSVFFSYSLLGDTQFADTIICPGQSVTYALNGFMTYTWVPAAGLNCTTCPTVTATPQTTTAYTLFATNTDGCELRDTFEIAVRSIPVLELGPDVILCTDTTIVFDAGPGFATYLWQDGTTAQTITAVDPGTYHVEATEVCGGVQRDSVFFSFSLLPDTQFGDTVICPGESVSYSLNGFTTYAWAPAAGLNCTTCPTVTAAPQATTTYTLFAYDNNGCELRDTFTVEVRGPANLMISCPANLTVQAAPGEQIAVVNYADPITTTDCVCDAPVWTRTQGLASGAAFPIGPTQVCFSAEDGCNSSATCCFTVTVEKGPDPQGPCDVKETPCVRFEILAIFQNAKKQKTYRMRVINKCANELMYVSYQLPDGITAKAPANASIYTTPAGRQYEVRNSAAHKSVRFKSIGPGIANGQSDIFEYTLPAQSDPTFIHATVRLAPQIIVETHLNVFACVVQQVPANLPDEQAADRTGTTVSEKTAALRLFPNPVSDRLQVDLSAWANQTVRLTVTDALGRILLEERVWAVEQIHVLELPQDWPSGVYSLTVTGQHGERATGRFVKR